MTPRLIGYFPKRRLKRPDWLKAANVQEVCSVSTCISEGPEGWVDRWRHNEMWAYDTPELAWSMVPEEERGAFNLYAYEVFPVFIDGGQEKEFEFPVLQVQQLTGSFERLGYDVVSRSLGTTFECSPLSCNHMAEEIVVTRHCLVSELDTAFELARRFDASVVEPGPYFVVLVWREKSAG